MLEPKILVKNPRFFSLTGRLPRNTPPPFFIYEQKLSEDVRTIMTSNVDAPWNQRKWTLYVAAGFATGPKSVVYQRH